MLLAEEGRLSLFDPVTQYLPDYTTFAPSGRQVDITIRQLLNHSSGMKDLKPTELVGWIHRADQPAVDQVALLRLRMQRFRKLANEPGLKASYSNAGYVVLSAIVEIVSAEPYETFVRSRILGPLAMKDTDFVYRSDLIDRAVAGSHPLLHYYLPVLLAVHPDCFSNWVAGIRRRRMWLKPFYTDYTGPTGLIGPALDLARFRQAFLDAGTSGGDRSCARKPSPRCCRTATVTVTARTMSGWGWGGTGGPTCPSRSRDTAAAVPASARSWRSFPSTSWSRPSWPTTR
jgi:CubicO group peptidase (beta-lactamase class C family)